MASSIRVFALLSGLIAIVIAANSLAMAQPTPPSTDDQVSLFHLPDGFEIQLVLSDPDIGQPMNLNFDARGRLWLTHSVEYPYPAHSEGVEPDRGKFAGGGNNPPRDRLTVVEIGPRGSAQQITHFASGLNIPIGNVPLDDGSEALVYAIPSIFHVVDDNHDGQSDAITTRYTRFGNIDVHGNASSFTRGIDGWIYGCHGFSNHSEVSDASGNVVKLHSGNTYRFRDDGSHFELWTAGQVNPFGMTFDPLGNLFNSDCHSKPVYQLLRGATYPQFSGNPPPIGYGPTMIDHQHGSTGICGPAYYAAEHFPEKFRDNLFICNPVTGRVHRDQLTRVGSTLLCQTQPDFITSNDPWFRPVDAIVGPDGALYIADFCNLVIGHYEAPLDHPDRDRTHGRVWRVVYQGDATTPVQLSPTDLTQLSANELVDRLSDPNLQVRTLATSLLVDRANQESLGLVRDAVESSNTATARAHGLWVLERTKSLDDETLKRLAHDPAAIVRIHLMKMLAERIEWTATESSLARAALHDSDAFVQRAAVDALGRHPACDNVKAILQTWATTPADDTHLHHTLRLSLRDHLLSKQVITGLPLESIEDDLRERLIEVSAVTDGDHAAGLSLTLLETTTNPEAWADRIATQIGNHGTDDQVAKLFSITKQRIASDANSQFQILEAVANGMQHRGKSLDQSEPLRVWWSEIAAELLGQIAASPSHWANHQVPGITASESPWGIRQRKSADGNSQALFWDSISAGESLTGILRSPPFTVPTQIQFWMCGHNGILGSPDTQKNLVRLVDLESGQTIAKQSPPRSDVAVQYTWDLTEHAGRTAVIEIVDADQADAYAWVAVGRIEPAVVTISEDKFSDRIVELAGEFGLTEHAAVVASLACDANQSPKIRKQAMTSSLRLSDEASIVPILNGILTDSSETNELRVAAAESLANLGSEVSHHSLAGGLETSPHELQRAISAGLARKSFGIELLLSHISLGKASPRLLKDVRISELIQRNATSEQKKRIAELTRDLPPEDKKTTQLLVQLRERMGDDFSTDGATEGEALFKQQCATCHQIAGQGGVVGPQLDGVGNRGVERLLEDVVDPNRNVDVAFRMTQILTLDGNIVTGLLRREEGGRVVIADQTGKEFSLATDSIEQRKDSTESLMPANFAETMTAQQIQRVVAFLLTQQSATEATGE
ncbi:membrane-bound dehydrogenase domain protein [Rhodopirellula maiorica SM1]|uniref:Membrane-bound dehydrogenase domain protein n=1 Tax=Rhodopirellula maiorica SM1 TaxID=1265738 RepID=M5RH54_9BACT|nr:c-type cytochrome [Rhodopirellula maiorica]EMI18703.1 membrane-bound dehydrogenase domain protein [Rhodopirellula maiorica SM1]